MSTCSQCDSPVTSWHHEGCPVRVQKEEDSRALNRDGVNGILPGTLVRDAALAGPLMRVSSLQSDEKTGVLMASVYWFGKGDCGRCGYSEPMTDSQGMQHAYLRVSTLVLVEEKKP